MPHKAIAEHLSGQLLITGAQQLWVLMDGMRYLAREPTEEKLMEGWKLLCDKVITKMDITAATRASVIKYLNQFWLGKENVLSVPLSFP